MEDDRQLCNSPINSAQLNYLLRRLLKAFLIDVLWKME